MRLRPVRPQTRPPLTLRAPLAAASARSTSRGGMACVTRQAALAPVTWRQQPTPAPSAARPGSGFGGGSEDALRLPSPAVREAALVPSVRRRVVGTVRRPRRPLPRLRVWRPQADRWPRRGRGSGDRGRSSGGAVNALKAPRTCKGCGCTDERGCRTPMGSCFWVRPGVCSACASDAALAKKVGPRNLSVWRRSPSVRNAASRGRTFVRRGPGLRHMVDASRGTHTVCGISIGPPKPKGPYDSGHSWRVVGKDDKTKICGSCDRMKDADTMQGRP
jgi:hypothetical protein